MNMKVKICGITNLEDALRAVEHGAWAVGFVFEPNSPRYISPVNAGKIAAELPKEVHKIGVFVNETALNVNRMAFAARLTMVQLHGEEKPEDAVGIKLPVIKAIRPQTEGEIEGLKAWDVADFVLVDAYVKGQRGGTGKVANWPLAKKLVERYPTILAGGITPENVSEAIKEVHPKVIDLSSGVECEAGHKSDSKLKKLFKNINELNK